MLRTAILVALAALLLPAAPATAWTDDFGHTRSRDRVLRHGCHDYPYRFVVKAPTDDWTLETFLIDPTGEGLGSGAFSSESDPDRGRSEFRICRYTTQPGRFTIRAKLVWYRGYDEHIVRFKPSHFRLHRAS